MYRVDPFPKTLTGSFFFFFFFFNTADFDDLYNVRQFNLTFNFKSQCAYTCSADCHFQT